MPQMYPMNWIFLFMLFILIFSFSLNKIFFNPNLLFSYKVSSNISSQNLIWMW